MSQFVALLVAISLAVTALIAVVNAVTTLQATREARKANLKRELDTWNTQVKLEQVHILVNSRLDEQIALTKKALERLSHVYGDTALKPPTPES